MVSHAKTQKALIKPEDSVKRLFVLYATANDDPRYVADKKNLIRLSRIKSGTDKIILIIAISEVNKKSSSDQVFLNYIYDLFSCHSFISLQTVFFKTNVGRDFSSYAQMLRLIQNSCILDDYLFFLNRSSRGPYRKEWARIFIEQYNRFENIAICGSTINLVGKSNNSTIESLSPHVQTYSFLTQMKHLVVLENNFPAEGETDRLRIIQNGEIELSRKMLAIGMGITCIEWPDVALYDTEQIPDHLPRKDIKNCVKKKHIFYHRKYFKRKYKIGCLYKLIKFNNLF